MQRRTTTDRICHIATAFAILPLEVKARQKLLPKYLSTNSRFGAQKGVWLVISYHCNATSSTLKVAPPLLERRDHSQQLLFTARIALFGITELVAMESIGF
ncbi:TPA: hypothetical protein ACH3X1_016714 [Trebouxia sp. C0004]